MRTPKKPQQLRSISAKEKRNPMVHGLGKRGVGDEDHFSDSVSWKGFDEMY